MTAGVLLSYDRWGSSSTHLLVQYALLIRGTCPLWRASLTLACASLSTAGGSGCPPRAALCSTLASLLCFASIPRNTMSESKARYSYARAILGKELFEKVQTAKILCVGAGGIGAAGSHFPQEDERVLTRCAITQAARCSRTSFRSDSETSPSSVVIRVVPIEGAAAELTGSGTTVPDRSRHYRPVQPEQAVPLSETARQAAQGAGSQRDGKQVQPFSQDRCNTRERERASVRCRVVQKLRPRYECAGQSG